MARLAGGAASCLGRFGGAERAPIPGVRVRRLHTATYTARRCRVFAFAGAGVLCGALTATVVR